MYIVCISDFILRCLFVCLLIFILHIYALSFVLVRNHRFLESNLVFDVVTCITGNETHDFCPIVVHTE